MIKTKEDLKKFRLKLGKTQEQFANDLGVSLNYYGKVESGQLAFYSGINKAVNDYAKRLEAYKKGKEIYEEALNRCYCNHCDDQTKEQIEKEDKEINKFIYGCICLFVVIVAIIAKIFISLFV